MREERKHLALLVFGGFVFVWSAIDCYDRMDWFLLALPAIIMVFVLICTYKKFRFSTFTYVLVLIHIIILLIGAKYTYTRNPLFETLTPIFNFSRNHYDRVGHLAQGFIPVFMAKEIILRNNYMKRSKFFYLLLLSFILAISAAWELLEFGMTFIYDKPATYILATQGDMWDCHWDMLLALVGGTVGLLLLGRIHDKVMGPIKK